VAEVGDDLREGMEILTYQGSQVMPLHPAWCGLLADLHVQLFGEVAQPERDFAEKEVVADRGQHTAVVDVPSSSCSTTRAATGPLTRSSASTHLSRSSGRGRSPASSMPGCVRTGSGSAGSAETTAGSCGSAARSCAKRRGPDGGTRWPGDPPAGLWVPPGRTRTCDQRRRAVPTLT
jgi:hypothetical protein